MKRRIRFKQTTSLRHRLIQLSRAARTKASNFPPGLERERYLKKAIEAERSIQIEQWLRTPASARQSKGAELQ